MNTRKQTFEVEGRVATLYQGEREGGPLVILNNYSGDGSSVFKAMRGIDTPDCSLLVVGELRWDHDMTPWYCPPLSKGDTPCTGGAGDYLGILLDEIIPQALGRIAGRPAYTAIAGYSLAGLFALWSMYNCDAFARVATMSGSLWFPDFAEYAMAREMVRAPERLYLSLGDVEARTRNQVLRTVREHTETLVGQYRAKGFDVAYELNPGNHFKDPALRTAKGIKAILA